MKKPSETDITITFYEPTLNRKNNSTSFPITPAENASRSVTPTTDPVSDIANSGMHPEGDLPPILSDPINISVLIFFIIACFARFGIFHHSKKREPESAYIPNYEEGTFGDAYFGVWIMVANEHIIWPAITLCIGVFLGFRLKSYLAGRRRLS